MCFNSNYLHRIFQLALVKRLDLTYGIHRRRTVETVKVEFVEEENQELRTEELPEKVASQSQRAWLAHWPAVTNLIYEASLFTRRIF